MTPDFAVEGGLPLALARGSFVFLLLAAFGAALFAAVVAPRALARADAATRRRVEARSLGLLRILVGGALLASPVWLLLQAADMAGAAGPAAALAAAPVVLGSTAFGHLALAQEGVLLAAALPLGRRSAPRARRIRFVAVLLGVATALQAGHGHAWSMYGRPSPLLLAGALHLLAAGGWLGGLVPLLLLVRDAPPRIGAAGARWFSPLGKWCVGGMAVSSAWQFWQLIGGLPGLVGTAYGWVAGLKLALLGVLLGFALLNRYRLAPALLAATPERARVRLIGAIGMQTGFGVLTVLAAGVLGSLPPSVHVQPVWPFPERFSLDTLGEDPGFRNEVIGAGFALIGAALVVAAAILMRRRLRRAVWLPVAGAAAIAWFAVPHLDLLLVEAYPTSYYRSPTGFAADAIVEGAALFPRHCAACHGAQGRGDGPAAAGLPVPPANLTATHLWMHSDGELFWWLTHGIDAPNGDGLAMPGFAASLSPEQRWALIDYVRAHNAGLVGLAGAVMNEAGARTPPLQAPDLQVSCAGGSGTTLAALRGRFVRLAFGSAVPPAAPGVSTILVDAGAAGPASAGPCVARDAAVPAAYAIATGIPAAALDGMQMLIDDAGYLRDMQHSAGSFGWGDPDTLLAEVRSLRAHPVGTRAGMDHAHMRM